MTKTLAAAVVAGAFLLTAGCSAGKYTEPYKDAPRSNVVNNDEADIITMPDGFSNMATKCDHGNRVYSAYHGDHPYGTIQVVPHDETCRQ